MNAEVAFLTARSLLNDLSNYIWTDNYLLPFLVKGFRELEDELRACDAPIMKALEVVILNPSATSFNSLPSSRVLIAPIRMQERPQSDPNDSTYSLMTEWNPLPYITPGALRVWWNCDGLQVNVNPAIPTTLIKVEAWARLAEPTSGDSPLIFPEAEDYLGPRTAALACKSVGENARHDTYTALAKESLADIIYANRGRSKNTPKP
jgi:hypothetical protein